MRRLSVYLRFVRYEIYAARRCFQLLIERRKESLWSGDIIAFGDAAVAYLPGLRSHSRPKLWLPLNNESRLERFYELYAGIPTNIGVRRLSAEEAAERAAHSAIPKPCEHTMTAIAKALDEPLPQNVSRIRSKKGAKQ